MSDASIGTTSGACIVNFEHISHIISSLLLNLFFYASWARETIVQDNKFVFSNWDI